MESWMKSITPYQFPEMLPEALINHYKFPARIDAIRQMHFPKNLEEATRAKDRLIFEEFFINQASLMIQKLYRKNNIKGYVFGQIGHYFNTFYKDHLPFELTNAQKRVIKEIRIDSGSGFQLNRLLQGDVGSGKTIVALMASLIAIDNGYQVCIMAPLEILAQQHFRSIKKLIEPLGLKVELLTGSTKKKERVDLFKATRIRRHPTPHRHTCRHRASGDLQTIGSRHHR
jgi:ATP-dependent DNA helicase RecG